MEKSYQNSNPRRGEYRSYPFYNKYSNMLKNIATGALIISIISSMVIWSESGSDLNPLGIILVLITLGQGIVLFVVLNAVAQIGNDVSSIKNSVYDETKENSIKQNKKENMEEYYTNVIKLIEEKVRKYGSCSLSDTKKKLNKIIIEKAGKNSLESKLKLQDLDMFFENQLQVILENRGYSIETVDIEKSGVLIKDKVVK